GKGSTRSDRLLADKTGAPALADGGQATHQLGPFELIMAVEEEDLVDPVRQLADAQGIDGAGLALQLDLLQQGLGEGDLAGVLARRLPVEILDEIPPPRGQQREELAQGQLLIKGRMAAVVDDDLQRARLDLGHHRTKRLQIRLISDEGGEALAVEAGKVGQVDAEDMAEGKE